MNEFTSMLNSLPNRTSGWVLKANRACLQLSLEILSTKTGIGLATLQSYEQNKLAINSVHAELIAKELGIPAQNLNNYKGNK